MAGSRVLSPSPVRCSRRRRWPRPAHSALAVAAGPWFGAVLRSLSTAERTVRDGPSFCSATKNKAKIHSRGLGLHAVRRRRFPGSLWRQSADAGHASRIVHHHRDGHGLVWKLGNSHHHGSNLCAVNRDLQSVRTVSSARRRGGALREYDTPGAVTLSKKIDLPIPASCLSSGHQPLFPAQSCGVTPSQIEILFNSLNRVNATKLLQF